jgi:hypothetical protein
MKFKEYLINEGNTASATNMELAIVQSSNGDKLRHPEFTDQASNIVEYLKHNGISGKGEHMGSGSYPISPFWVDHGGTDSTPKTDLMIGKAKISLKKEGGSQLMSGKEGESRATFYSAVKISGIKSAPMISEVEGYFSRFVDSKDKLNITQQKKSGNVRQDVLDAGVMHKEFTKYLSKQFSTDKSFRNAFIYEAMSGITKFNDGRGTASHILVFDPINGVKNELHKVDDKSYINKKASGTKVGVSWKSTSSNTKSDGKVYSFFSVIRLLSGKANEEIEKYDTSELNEGIISSIKDKVMSFFKVIWRKIKKWLSKSIENIISFFDIEPVISPVVMKF